MNIIDELISFISPSAGLRRTRARVASDMIRKYDAASHGRRTKNWDARDTSANSEIKHGLETLRARSRDMVRNNTYAKIAIEVIATNTIGTGIRATVRGEDDATKVKTLAEWNAWAGTTACDFDGKLDFYGIQELVMRAVAESGECLVLRRRNNDKKKLPVQIQVLEADYLYPHNDSLGAVKITPNSGNIVLQGVEFDTKGKRVAYWLYTSHPGDSISDLQPIRVPAKDVIHIFKTDRPGQVRGVPFGASALVQLKDLQDYQDAALVRQKVAACFTVFITEPQGDQGGSGDSVPLEKVEPGIIEHLAPGKEVNFASPPSTDGYAEYVKRILQGIASGFGITYEALTTDLSMVNFSSGRMGWLEFYRRVQSWQFNIIVPLLCEGVWSWFLEAGQLSGKLQKEVAADWTPARREMIDPVKEVKGITASIRAGLVTWQEAVREQGYDPKEVVKQIAEDYKDFDANGIKLTSDVRNDIKAPVEPKDPSEAG